MKTWLEKAYWTRYLRPPQFTQSRLWQKRIIKKLQYCRGKKTFKIILENICKAKSFAFFVVPKLAVETYLKEK